MRILWENGYSQNDRMSRTNPTLTPMAKKKVKEIEVGILIGYGDNCDCLEYGKDCPVLYGGECDWKYKHEA